MRQRTQDAAKELATKGLALVVLLIAAYVLFRVVLGILSAVFWVVAAVVAVVAVLWALNRLL